MTEPQVQIATGGLTQWQRLAYAFTAPSKTFEDIKRGNRSWWLPFLITLLTGTLLWIAVGQMVTWRGVFENNQRNMPEMAKRMMENMPPDQKAKQEQRGPVAQKVTWALAPFGLLLLNLIGSALYLATINFGFGGRARFSEVFAVTLYAWLVIWPIKLLLGAIALYAGALPDAFNPNNPAGTNLGYYFSPQDMPGWLYLLASSIDPLAIWSTVLTAIGLAMVAGTKRSAGYITAFGWWAITLMFFLGVTAIFS